MNPDWSLRDALLKMLHTFLRLRFDQSKTVLVLKRKQKRDQADTKALKLYFQSFFCRKSNNRNFKIFLGTTSLAASS